MRNIWIIAKTTFRLETRSRLLYGILIFAFLYIFFEIFLANLVLKELPMVKSFGLTGIYFFNAIIALFLGTTSFFKDVERKVVYFVLSKPVSRAQFLIGKFVGLCLVLLLTTAILAVGYIGLIAYEHGGFDALGLTAIGMQYLEMAIFIAFALFVSTFSSSLISIVYTSAVFFLGHVVSQLLVDAKQIGVKGTQYFLVQAFYYIFPNLEKFDVRDLAIHGVAVPLYSVALAFAYALAYIVLLVTAATWIFSKKEI